MDDNDTNPVTTRTKKMKVGHKQVHELSSEDLVRMMNTGAVELVIDSALSEWGSVVEEFFHKLERTVNDWHDPEVNRSVVVTFAEVPVEIVVADRSTHSAAVEEAGS